MPTGVLLFEVCKWLLALASLVGVVLNVKHNRACFAIWSGTNALWCLVDCWHGVYAQAALQGVYCALAVWGLVAWRAAPGQEDERG